MVFKAGNNYINEFIGVADLAFWDCRLFTRFVLFLNFPEDNSIPGAPLGFNEVQQAMKVANNAQCTAILRCPTSRPSDRL
jgi:hypothetical protein